jgi:hypothetical protein
MTDAKEWVTIRVPEADRDAAKNRRPEEATHGDCLVAGAEQLNEHTESDPSPAIGNADMDVDALRAAILEELETNELAFDDVKNACETAIEETLPVEEMGGQR